MLKISEQPSVDFTSSNCSNKFTSIRVNRVSKHSVIHHNAYSTQRNAVFRCWHQPLWNLLDSKQANRQQAKRSKPYQNKGHLLCMINSGGFAVPLLLVPPVLYRKNHALKSQSSNQLFVLLCRLILYMYNNTAIRLYQPTYETSGRRKNGRHFPDPRPDNTSWMVSSEQSLMKTRFIYVSRCLALDSFSSSCLSSS